MNFLPIAIAAQNLTEKDEEAKMVLKRVAEWINNDSETLCNMKWSISTFPIDDDEDNHSLVKISIRFNPIDLAIFAKTDVIEPVELANCCDICVFAKYHNSDELLSVRGLVSNAINEARCKMHPSFIVRMYSNDLNNSYGLTLK